MAGIFKAYDIRGIYGDVLNADMGYKIGVGYANFIGAGKHIVCGRDDRLSSVELQTALINGLRDGGCHVTNMDLCTTPMTYFACATDTFDGAVMVTASHNPGQYNGLKFCREEAKPVAHANGLDKVEAAINAGELHKAETRGDLTTKDYQDAYLEFLKSRITFTRQFGFAADCGNGMGGYLIQSFLDKVGQNAHELYWDLDFTFPNHEANPLQPKNMADLQAMVRDKGLDFGVAFDGDADRCFFVDDQGEIVPADILTALIAIDMLDQHGGGAIIYDIRSSRVVAEKIEEHGGKPVLCRVGHSFMKAKLREEQGPFGGELAGHFYFRDFFYADSAFLTMVHVMNILEKHDAKLSELTAPLKKYHPSGEINFKTDKADHFISTAAEKFPGGEVTTIDGIRIDFEDRWFCLRKSNTEPLLRLVAEAKEADAIQALVGELKDWLFGGGAELADGH